MSDAAVADADTQPVLRVVRGEPTPEEVAALVTVLSAMAVPAESGEGLRAASGRRRSTWTSRDRLMRTTWRYGPTAWRASASRR